ncbi:MAG: response regulator transcription factor [Clostridiales bacterium]|nr:response regulator transcription factor [Clostridiales bacterium]
MIYLVEDDENIRELVVYTLNATGYQVKGFSHAQPFYQAVKQQTPDLILLDIMLPDTSGLDILASLRSCADTRETPVMMLTAKSSEHDKVVGLDSGADDYLPKPFGMMELLARVKALLRRSNYHQKNDTPLSVGSIVLYPDRHLVTVEQQPVSLTLKEYELLSFLMENSGIVFTRNHLLQSVWGYDYQGETRTVDVHIRSLRQKLGTQAASHIETIRGVGYKINEVPQ